MVFTIILIGFLSSFVLIYSQELGRLYSKLIVVPGVKLFVPLLFVSWLIETYQDWARWLLLYSQAEIYNTMQMMARFLPFGSGSFYVIRIAFLFFLACCPVLIGWVKTKRRGLFELPESSYYVGTILWIIAVFLLTIGSN